MLVRRLRVGGSRIRLVASATSTTAAGTIVVPAGCQAGDLFILVNLATNSTSAIPTTVVPSGFTEAVNGNFVSTATGRGMKQIISFAVPGSDISGTTLTCMNGSNSDSMALAVFRGRQAFVSAAAFDPESHLADTDAAAQTVNASGETGPLVVVGGGLNVVFASASVSITAVAGQLKALPYDGAAADVVIDATIAGIGGILQSCYIQLAY